MLLMAADRRILGEQPSKHHPAADKFLLSFLLVSAAGKDVRLKCYDCTAARDLLKRMKQKYPSSRSLIFRKVKKVTGP